MQVLRNTCSFREALLKTDHDAAGHLMQPKSIKHQDGKHTAEHDDKAEPPGLPQRGRNLEGGYGFGAVPNSSGIAGYDAKAVWTMGEIGIRGFPLRSGLAPVVIVALQLVSEPDTLRNGEAQSGIPDSDPARGVRKLECRPRLEDAPIH